MSPVDLTPDKPSEGLSADDKHNLAPRRGFLDLPRELRDEIYAYLLKFDHTAVTTRYDTTPIRSMLLGVNLSILRVNRQLHDEAAEMFYSKNVFPIKIFVQGFTLSRTRIPPSRYADDERVIFNIRYRSPWEYLRYYINIDPGDESTNYNHKPIPGAHTFLDDARSFHGEPDTPIPWHEFEQPWDRVESLGLVPGEIGPMISASARYRPLLRHIHIQLLDSKSRLMYGAVDSIEFIRDLCPTLLLPFLPRLQILLSDARELATVDVHASFCLQYYPSPNRDGESFEFAVRAVRYAEIIKEAWLFSRGPWKFRLSMSNGFEDVFPGLLDATISQCEADFDEKELQEKLEYLKINVPDSHCWIRHRGRLALSYQRDLERILSDSPSHSKLL